MIILDTNVLSALMRPDPDKAVANWLNLQSPLSVWTTSISIMEIRYGLQILPEGKKRSRLLQELDNVLGDEIGERIAPFDLFAARHAADLMESRYKSGRPGELRDTMIAGIALANRATLATRNTSHFKDLSVPLVNPWSPEEKR